MSRRMTAAQVPDLRALLQAQQEDRCRLCDKKFYDKMPLDPVLDHCHKTGAIRGVIHRGCNTLLGKIENYLPRAWLKPADLPTYAAGLADYLLSPSPAPGVLHFTHRTPEQKAVRTKVRAKKRRVAKKAAA
jgi:hypothetical protein